MDKKLIKTCPLFGATRMNTVGSTNMVLEHIKSCRRRGSITAALPRTVAAIQILQVGEPPCGDSGNTVRKLRHYRGDSNAGGLRHCREESDAAGRRTAVQRFRQHDAKTANRKKSRAEALPYRTSEKLLVAVRRLLQKMKRTENSSDFVASDAQIAHA